MNRRAHDMHPRLGFVALSLLIGLVAFAESPDLSWFTVAGGGATYSSGGGFTLGGTIGQPAVEVLTGGGFSLEGGFWRGVSFCDCHGDLSADSKLSGMDIRGFVQCFISSRPDCDCTDMNRDGARTLDDLPLFVDALLIGQACPN